MEEIKKFLNELLDETTNKIVDTELKIDELDIKIKENSRFSEVLKKENEPPFSEFSPRNISNRNLEEVKKIDNDTEGMSSELNNLKIEKNNLQKRSDRIVNMLAELDDYNSDTKFVEKIVEEENVDYIKDSLNTIISYLPSDPMRAKIELANLRNNL